MQKHRSKRGNIATESIILYPDCKQVSSLDLPVHNFTGIYKLSAFAVVFWISLAGKIMMGLPVPCSDQTKKKNPVTGSYLMLKHVVIDTNLSLSL